MKNTNVTLASVVLGLCSSVALAAPTTYSFDTLTALSLHSSNPSLTGVLRNALAPTTISFADNTNVSFRYVVNRCVPVFLTMIEKPGRYYLNVTIDTALPNVQLISCGLELRS